MNFDYEQRLSNPKHPIIKRLDIATINQIAAGEVVERPLSVIKELCENSIDANATQITIEIKDGGIAYMRVTDNGIGIGRDQVPAAFDQHATSKISIPDDLSAIETLGFRGEALASIAAVSQAEMITKPANQINGTRIVVHASEQISLQDIGCADGATVIIRGLFYNTPARLRFLKKPATETSYISEMVNKLALGHPEIAFKYIVNGNMVLQTDGKGDLRLAVFRVYGKDFSKLIDVERREANYGLAGLLGKPEISRANRSRQVFFVNGRYVKSALLQEAVEEAFDTLLMSGRFPGCILHMWIKPHLVDVNVHPNKLEIRFADEVEIKTWMTETIHGALANANLIPSVSMAQRERKTMRMAEPAVFQPVYNQHTVHFNEAMDHIESGHIESDHAASDHKENQNQDIPQGSEPLPVGAGIEWDYDVYVPERHIVERDKAAAANEDGRTINANADNDFIPGDNSTPDGDLIFYDDSTLDGDQGRIVFNDYRVVGQIFNTYWIIEQSGRVFVMDQHAAHERVIYESLMSGQKSKEVSSQRLFHPIEIDLPHSDISTFERHEDFFEELGFEAKRTATGVEIYGLPHMLRAAANEGFFLDVLDSLNSATTATKEDLALRACKAAVKANDRLSEQEVRQLITDLLKLPNPFTCPHGRPTMVEMKKYEWEKKFKRKV
ncbi:MAG: DNA mismatch repair endonuclease MutL [Clostridiales bacterium]|jgi:DNA mismatch repair protein MutL|nr:DNA mismatch repair endonuclease MutL [Clostridiales bacterium]